MQELFKKNIEFYGKDFELALCIDGRYRNTNNICIEAYDVNTGEPFETLTTNFETLENGYFYAKDDEDWMSTILSDEKFTLVKASCKGSGYNIYSLYKVNCEIEED